MDGAFRRAAGSLACAAALWWTASRCDVSRRPALEPARARALWDDAVSARGEGRLNASLGAVRRLLASYPGEPRYLGFQAEILELARRPLDAARSWELFLRVAPFPADACPSLGRDYVLAGLAARGLDADRRCLALDPSKPDLMISYALALERARRDAEAEPLLAGALKQNPNDADAVAALARLLVRRGDLDAAEKITAAALAVSPGNSDVLLAAARVSEERGDFKAARERLELAIRRSPDYGDLYRALAKVLAKAGDDAGAGRARAAAAAADARSSR